MTEQIQWHQIFGAVQQEHLARVNINVETEVPLTTQPTRSDMLILQPSPETGWTEEQRSYLPDGLRDNASSHNLLELKYTESVNQNTFEQVISASYLFRQHRHLSRQQLHCFIISSYSTEAETRQFFGYTHLSQPGIYHSQNPFLEQITLILLNELRDEPHNVFFKLFGSQKRAKLAAITGLKNWWVTDISSQLLNLVQGLAQLWFKKGDLIMEVITVEKLIEAGRKLNEAYIIAHLPEEYLLKLLKDSPILAQVRAEGEAEGEAKGKAEGEAKGKAEGEAKGKAEGEAKGKAEGEAKGKHQVMVKNIARALTIRFEADMATWQAKLEPLSLETLDPLVEVALTVTTLAEFETAWEQVRPQPNPDEPENNLSE